MNNLYIMIDVNGTKIYLKEYGKGLFAREYFTKEGILAIDYFVDIEFVAFYLIRSVSENTYFKEVKKYSKMINNDWVDNKSDESSRYIDLRRIVNRMN